MAIKIIALDVDGTLTNKRFDISLENTLAIRKAQEQGVFVTISTGRGYLASRGIWQKLQIAGPIINYGGALVTDTATDEIIYIEALEPDVITDAFHFANEIGVHIQLYQGDMVITAKDDPFIRRYGSNLRVPVCVDPDVSKKTWNNVPKLLAYADPAIEDEIRDLFKKRLDGRAGVSKTQPGYIEINGLTASKGKALEAICRKMGILQSEAAAIGDSYLDMSMIEWAGEGVCVENGLDAVKAISNRIVPSCDDNGVAYYIEHFVLR